MYQDEARAPMSRDLGAAALPGFHLFSACNAVTCAHDWCLVYRNPIKGSFFFVWTKNTDLARTNLATVWKGLFDFERVGDPQY